MKIWRFYTVDSEMRNLNGLTIKDKYPLYAITNKKKYAKAFKKGRNMNRYICKCTNTTKEEGMEFLNKYRGCVLDYYHIVTKGESIYTPKEISILLSENEDNILNEIVTEASYLEEISFINPDIFSKSTMKLLYDIEYFDLFLLMTGGKIKGYNPDELPQIDLENVDELGVFTYVYHDVIDYEHFPETLKY